MSGPKRIFSKEQLEEFSKDFAGLTMEALERGDIEKAKYWLRRLDATKDIMHDQYLYWVASLYDWIYREYGEDVAVKSMKDTMRGPSVAHAIGIKQLIEAKGVGGWVETIVDVFRHHAMHPNMKVEEDDEKFIFTLQPCGSGGRLIEAGLYDGLSGFAKLKKAGPHTWGESDLPIYCNHCTWANEIHPTLLQGYPMYINASPFPKKPGDPCVWYLFKDPKDIPEEYYERIGMTRQPKTLPPSYGIDPDKDAAAKNPNK